MRGRVLRPGDPGFAEVTSGFNRTVGHSPDLVVVAADAGDVQTAVRYAADTGGMPVAVMATGHQASVPITGGLLVATRELTAVGVDRDARSARVGAGALWGPVVDLTAAAGLAPLAGSSPTVGVTGYTLGGGLSPLLGRAHGYAADHVTGFEIVTADGALRWVTADSEPDLFWAVRGGKGNFGIVTALEFGLFPVTRLYAGPLLFPGEAAGPVLSAWRDWTATVPDEVTSSAALLRVPDAPAFPEPLRGRQVLSMRVAFAGPAERGAALVAPLRAAGPVLVDAVAPVPVTAFAGIHADPTDPVPAYERTALLRELPDTAIERIVAVAGSADPAPLAIVELRALGGALGRPPLSPTRSGTATPRSRSSAWASPRPSRRRPPGPPRPRSCRRRSRGAPAGPTSTSCPATTPPPNASGRPTTRPPTSGWPGSRARWTPVTCSVSRTPSRAPEPRPEPCGSPEESRPKLSFLRLMREPGMRKPRSVGVSSTTGGLRFTLLGPVQAWHADAEVPLGSTQQRAAFAVLLLRANAHVGVADLVGSLWGDSPPRSAEQVVRTYVYRLRKALQPHEPADPVIASVGSGYLVRATPANSDLAAFRQALTDAERARHAGDAAGSAAHLRAGLALWRGDALADIPGEYAARQRDNLHRMRTAATEELLAADVELGPTAETVTQLAGLVDESPLNERLRELLMLALYRHGEQARALDVYRRAGAVLAAELGIDPGPGLRAMFERILRSDPALLPAPPPAPAPARPAGVVPPAQLPGDLRGFAGRGPELARLTSMLSTVGERAHGGPVVVLTGMPGVGKTTLAVHWAHRIAPRHPDGVLYVDLHGSDPDTPAAPVATALATVLQTFGTAPDALPDSPAALLAAYRNVLAGRRVLLVLDDAADADQVRPLLPGTAGSLVVVTSRNRLPGLVTVDGAAALHLDPLDPAAARAVLVARLGRDAVAADPAAVDEIVERCAGLPLALAALAGRALTDPPFGLAATTARTREHTGLDAFHDVDQMLDLREVFFGSYRRLGIDAATAFRGLAADAGPEFGAPEAAEVLALPPTRVRRALRELTTASLVAEHRPGRFGYHPLLRAYAADLAAERTAAAG
ncbi:hypothetical protein BJF78_17390 [Pseudonocardia sp. CNS-139]|nr:hypothetical protein BJF78_17390 [Pseudonocardia sp. CNS-139]